MFIREVSHKNKNNNIAYSTYKIVESYRTEQGPRQRTILNLGTSFNLPTDQWGLLSRCIEEIITGRRSFIGYPEEIESSAQKYARMIIRQQASIVEIKKDSSPDYEPDYQEVDINSVQNENSRTIGAEHVVYQTIKELELDKKLVELGFNKPYLDAAIGVIAAKLIDPSSERAAHLWLKEMSGIDELMDTDFSELSQYRVYQVSDNLLKHKEEIEKYLNQKECNLFKLQEKVILYDLTNTFFEGSGKYNPKAHFGRSKEKRTDCPLVTMGLVLDGEGFPKKSKIFNGNVSEPATFKEAIENLSDKRSLTKPIIVMDAGIATESNIEWIKENKDQYSYVVVSRKRKSDIPDGIDMIAVKKDNGDEIIVRAGKVLNQESNEIELYCHSTGKEKKEESIKTSFMQRFEDELKKAKESISKKSGLKQYDKVVERIGRLKERFKRVAYRYTIEIKKDDNTNKAIDISWYQKESKKSEEKKYGVYCLRTNITNAKEQEIWDIYNMLTDIEDAFCCMKSELGLRPVHHQKENRVDGHLFITVLAYHILHTIRFKLRQKEIHSKWNTIRDILSNHVRTTTSMKTKDGKMIYIRKSGQAELSHKKIYVALDLPPQPGKTTKTIL